MEPIGGRARYAVSECQMPPKFCRSCSSFFTSMTSGNPGMPFTNGYSIGSPIRRANAMNSAGASVWPRKKITRWSRNARRISAMLSSGSARARSTPWISAPSAPERRRTSIVR